MISPEDRWSVIQAAQYQGQAEQAAALLAFACRNTVDALKNADHIAWYLYQMACGRKPSEVLLDEGRAIRAFDQIFIRQNPKRIAKRKVKGLKREPTSRKLELPIPESLTTFMREMRQWRPDCYREMQAWFLVMLAMRVRQRNVSRYAAIFSSDLLLQPEALKTPYGARFLSALHDWFIMMSADGPDAIWGYRNGMHGRGRKSGRIFTECQWLMRVAQHQEQGNSEKQAIEHAAGELGRDPKEIRRAFKYLGFKFK